jgi:hypothetical protein
VSPSIAADAPSPAASAAVTLTASPDWEALTSASFETPGADPSATWTALSWQDILTTSPLRIIRAVTHWHGGYIATGERGVWASSDGLRWSPLGAALPVKAAIVAETRTGLVAYAYDPDDRRCGNDAFCTPGSYDLPIETWVSSNGTTWQDRGVAAISEDRAFSIVGSPLGVLAYVADTGGVFHVLVSSDGIAWRAVAGCDDTRFAAATYVTGRLVTFCSGTALSDWDIPAVARWSSDGTSWHLGTIPDKHQAFHTAIGWLVAGRAGAIASGEPQAGSEEWWLTSDAIHWTLDAGYGPVASTPPGGMDNYPAANGDLESDGLRMLAVSWGDQREQPFDQRLSLDGRIWTSWDGRAWSPLVSSGQPLWTHSPVVFPKGVCTGGSWGVAS